MAEYFTKSASFELYDGTKKKVKFRGKTEAEAIAKLEKAKADYAAGKLTINGNTTFSQWVEEWKDVYGKGDTNQQYRSLLDNYFVPALGKIKLSALKLSHLQRVANSFEEMSYSQVTKAKIALNKVLEAALNNQIIVTDCRKMIVWPNGEKGIGRALTEQERKIFLNVIDKHRFGTFCSVMYGCGLRSGEVRALCWQDINFIKKEVNVHAAIKKQTQEIGDPKSKAGNRIVPIPAWVLSHLTATTRKSMFVFPKSNGQPFTPTILRNEWNSFKEAMNNEAIRMLKNNELTAEDFEQINIEELRQHYLRHTYCTILAENGTDIKIAQYLMGHSSITTTAQVYTHVTPRMLERAKEIIDNINTGI